MDVFPPQSDSVCDELFVKARPRQNAGESQRLKEIEGGGGWMYSRTDCQLSTQWMVFLTAESYTFSLWCISAAKVIIIMWQIQQKNTLTKSNWSMSCSTVETTTVFLGNKLIRFLPKRVLREYQYSSCLYIQYEAGASSKLAQLSLAYLNTKT